MESIIEVDHLAKMYQKKQALKNLSFQVQKGEIFGFLGPSGSGKTTTVKILTSQLRFTSGRVTVFGSAPDRSRNANFLGRIGILTDNSGLYDRLSVYDNLALFCRLYGVPEGSVGGVLEAVNLSTDRNTLVHQLSKGMKQRVTLARAILHRPEILFLDEPTSALDPVNVLQIHETLRQLNRDGTTIFLTTHNMQEAEALCDRVAFLNNGEISALDTPLQLRLQHGDQTITLTTPKGLEIVGQNAAGATRINELICSGELLAIHSNEPTLGDIFVKLTGRGLE
ncbi:ABC transporter ATP-binding protein [Paenibacillus radicis (ex Gao et al. 2016)]|uniref:Bacitracin ABC transporter ATP-binding protein n=1 Tax=Paenibacillus radicis (ex Gao et al. 2016) TaxID=1737354 RepID=A0A917H9K0_9BACL|nr:ABC transporter ATP-binding protein [Paenibacillus radicis (ex Gao et al. 2016)]GGG72016.1 bacitracin ABC transporter ATP-binding protein [Paenibacillus radicis (ex Gao et al. 2016)]